MKRNFILLSALCILVFLLGGSTICTAHAEEKNYFDDYPSSWKEIVPKGKTLITAKAVNRDERIRVTISWVKNRDNRKQLQKICERDNYVIHIAVNDDEIVMPSTVYCELNNLNRGRVFTEPKNYVLILDGGDASEAYYVKIDFDRDRVLRKRVYVATSFSEKTLLSDTTYYTVRM